MTQFRWVHPRSTTRKWNAKLPEKRTSSTAFTLLRDSHQCMRSCRLASTSRRLSPDMKNRHSKLSKFLSRDGLGQRSGAPLEHRSRPGGYWRMPTGPERCRCTVPGRSMPEDCKPSCVTWPCLHAKQKGPVANTGEASASVSAGFRNQLHCHHIGLVASKLYIPIRYVMFLPTCRNVASVLLLWTTNLSNAKKVLPACSPSPEPQSASARQRPVAD